MVAKCAVPGCSWRAAKEVEELYEVKKNGRLSCVFRISSNYQKHRENSFSPTSLPSLIPEERRIDIVKRNGKEKTLGNSYFSSSSRI